MSTSESFSRTPYIVVTVITLLLLFSFLVIVIDTHRRQTWIFTTTLPAPNPNSGLKKYYDDKNFAPPSEEEAEKRLNIICDSWDSLGTSTYTTGTSTYAAVSSGGGTKPGQCHNQAGFTAGYLP